LGEKAGTIWNLWEIGKMREDEEERRGGKGSEIELDPEGMGREDGTGKAANLGD
jgi:hypothetical protein